MLSVFPMGFSYTLGNSIYIYTKPYIIIKLLKTFRQLFTHNYTPVCYTLKYMQRYQGSYKVDLHIKLLFIAMYIYVASQLYMFTETTFICVMSNTQIIISLIVLYKSTNFVQGRSITIILLSLIGSEPLLPLELSCPPNDDT